MTRAVTIGGEFGSGREEIGRQLALRLGWRLLDNALIEEIARAGRVDRQVAQRYDECIDPWFHRLQKALWRGGYEGVATSVEADLFDADAMAELARHIIEEAASVGSCVIVGRGGQCVLQQRPDVFHVFIYAPLGERIQRAGAQTAVEAADRKRQAYIRRYFNQDWTNRHLYDLMLCSSMGERAAVAAILAAIREHDG